MSGIASAINAGEMSRPGWKANGRFHRPQGLGKWLRPKAYFVTLSALHC
ncbi:hypothetical protein ATN83_2621 [Raoultella ornithinolytica]|nr:hypothetical protein ATN83_2621 [Raoultella ornithinolytica]KDX14503.1 hypothetical protein AB28_2606 [Raoultella ornithinolytica 2-156-04_S1_C2]